MRKSSFYDELTIQNQFDRVCKLALRGECVMVKSKMKIGEKTDFDRIFTSI